MESSRVLEIFKEITRIPRESGHEEKINAYLLEFAEKHSLEAKSDKAGNVLIIKEAAPGYENVPALVLQSHTDMVCEKRPGVEHDFEKDPIKYVIEDGWMIAKDTTLGADCGIGVASQLALLESPLETGRIECLFTVSEETGLDGAYALEPGFISGNTLINLDSEDEGELFIGCAGGLDTTAVFNYEPEDAPAGYEEVKLGIGGCTGGHSGDDIDKGRANPIAIMACFLYTVPDFRICAIDGGNKRNAIARDISVTIAVPAEDVEILKQGFIRFCEDVRAEYAVTEPDMEYSFSQCGPCSGKVVGKNVSESLVAALFAAPHGVLAMSRDIKGLVETSSNLASVKMTGEGVIRIGTSQRSSVTSARKAAGLKVEAVFALAGAEVTHESEYPGWQPDLNSAILKKTRSAYEKLFDKEPVVRAIHAGLECGLFLDKYPGLDMISFGPTLRGVHAPGERLDIASLDRFVRLLEEVVVNFAKE